MIPAIVKDGNLFVEGGGLAGRFQDLTPPKLSKKMEEIMAGGMLGAVDIEMAIEKLTCSFTLYEWNKEILKQYGVVGNASIGLRFMFALERDDASGEVTPVEIVFRGKIQELDFNTFKKGDMTPLKVEMTGSYYRIDFDGETLIEIDMVGMVQKVNGVDVLADRRAAIGV